MERYFLGNNTAYGFVGYYEETLRSVDPVILLKGGPGTGKSSLLKKLAKDARAKGYDVELWYCSGDPSSLDGVYVKELNAAIVDATAPHATGADLPKIKDYIYDLASSLSHDKLAPHRAEIEALLARKKASFSRAYQHLRLAKCHLDNLLEIESEGLKEADIRAYAAVLQAGLREECPSVRQGGRKRRLFANAISPEGESSYFDHLRGRKIYRVTGSVGARAAFMSELGALLPCGTFISDPLEPSIIQGVALDGVAVTGDVGHLAGEVYENIDLGVYEGQYDRGAAQEEENSMTVEIAFAKEKLNRAREAHLGAEQYFIAAMDFENNNRICLAIEKQLGLK